MFDIITLTGDRPEAFSRCEYYLTRSQNINFDECHWIVVDDGHTPIIPKRHCTYHVNKPRDDKLSSFLKNLRAGLSYVKSDNVIFFEDDDWYSPDYLQKILNYLNTYEIVGEGLSYYYSVQTLNYKRNNNYNHASLCSTAFKSKFIPKILEITEKATTFVDTHFWDWCRRKKISRYIYTHEIHCVGIKNMPGRSGIGSGHRLHKRKHYLQDNDNLDKLREIIGDEDANYYKSVNQHFRCSIS